MKPDITFRLLTVHDAEMTRQLRLRACREESAAFLEAYEELVQLPPEDFKRRFENGWIAGAFMGNTLVGIAGLYRHKGLKVRHKGTVWGVYVAPEARGHGIAQRCIEMLLEQAAQADIELAQLSTDATNEATITLYKKLGFEIYGLEKCVTKIDDRYIDDVLMTKFLVQT